MHFVNILDPKGQKSIKVVFGKSNKDQGMLGKANSKLKTHVNNVTITYIISRAKTQTSFKFYVLNAKC